MITAHVSDSITFLIFDILYVMLIFVFSHLDQDENKKNVNVIKSPNSSINV